MKKWEILSKDKGENIVDILLKNRGIRSKKEIKDFLDPPYPPDLPNIPDMGKAVRRIQKAIKNKESIVVYADYDADGVTAGAIIWETLHRLGATVMPYIPHRVEEGYGLSVKGIDAVRERFDPSLIVTVDHGITAWEKVKYAKAQGIDVIVTDHHVKPKRLPDCTVVHTTALSGAGVSWCLAKELGHPSLELAAIGTIADMVPLVGPNRSIVKYGLTEINDTKRVGLAALIEDAGFTKGNLDVYAVSHMLAPRLNAMGRLEHAMDALRLLCTNQKDKAAILAQHLGLKNRERQQLTQDTVSHVLHRLPTSSRKLIFVSHESYNPGVIGLVAGKLVEEYYRPAIVVSQGEVYSKASARSVNGFNIVEAIRSCTDLLMDVGGHPMAAGFTVETKNLSALQERLEMLAEKELDEDKLTRTLKIDAEIPLNLVTHDLYKAIQKLQPFGFGNPEPVFATRGVTVAEARLVGAEGKHLKLKIGSHSLDAIAFNQGSLYSKIQPQATIDLAYTISLDTWNGASRLQLKVRDIHP